MCVLPVVVYICGPLETFLNIMKLFQSEIQDPENYAIFYLDVFAESLVDRKPWLNAEPDWTDPIAVFKVDRMTNLCYLCLNIIKHEKRDKGSFHDKLFHFHIAAPTLLLL